MTMTKVAIVTGANQGLGFALVRQLCRELGPDAIVYLSARDAARGEAAVELLRRDGLAPRFAQLDVRSDDSVAAAAAAVRAAHGGVDIVISNAAMRITPELAAADDVDDFIDTNNLGTHRMMRAFAPLLRDGARYLVVASALGVRARLSPALQPRFEASSATLASLADTIRAYAALVRTGRAEAEAWPAWVNIASKVEQVAAAKVLARELRGRVADILVNAVCPGLVDTDASRPWFADMSSALSPDAAAVDVVWLATLPPGTTEPHGALVQYRRVLD